MVSMSLPVAIAISMALSHSGHMPNEDLQSSMVFPDKRSFYTSSFLGNFEKYSFRLQHTSTINGLEFLEW